MTLWTMHAQNPPKWSRKSKTPKSVLGSPIPHKGSRKKKTNRSQESRSTKMVQKRNTSRQQSESITMVRKRKGNSTASQPKAMWSEGTVCELAVAFRFPHKCEQWDFDSKNLQMNHHCEGFFYEVLGVKESFGFLWVEV